METEENQQNEIPHPLVSLQETMRNLSDEELDKIGSQLKTQVEADIASRKDWLERAENAITLTTQVFEKKNWPWPNASNIKYPLISTAALQFHARSFPAIFGKDTLVKAKIVGRDKMGVKAARSNRVATYMNWQVLNEMEGWLDDQDRLLFILAIIGSAYKKMYYDVPLQRACSEFVHPRDFIINYDARDFKNARKTHRIWKTPNQIKELQNRGIYREIEDETFSEVKTASEARDKTQGLSKSEQDEEALQELYEVHCLLDLDEDGYKEPYVVTIRESDGKVYRIAFGFNPEDAEVDGNKIIAIKPKKYFVAYFFLPDPESAVHGIGFGTMVGPINEAVNTIVNQLTDAGTLSNLQSGMLGRGIRQKGGALSFKPGEWKTVNSTGDDLRKNVFPMPVREPSNVLFQLLGLLVESGKDLSSTQDIMMGKNPGQNQPFSTSQMVVQQGLQVFNGIYKRIYRSLTEEFKLLFKLNEEYPNIRKYMNVLDESGMEAKQAEQEVGLMRLVRMLVNDFSTKDLDIIPTAEPDMVADYQRLAKSAALMEKVAAGLPINPAIATRRMLEAEQHENIDELVNFEPPENPEIKFRQMELKLEQAKTEGDVLLKRSEAMLNDVKAKVALATAANQNTDTIFKQYMEEKKLLDQEYNSVTQRVQMLIQARENEQTRKEREQAKRTAGSGDSGG